MEREVKIHGLLIDPTNSSPVVLLKEYHSNNILPIWVGPFEANSIASEIEKVAPQRPMTHDLLKSTITQLQGTVSKVVITELKENTFYAVICIIIEGNISKEVLLDSRPSDAIALALRCDCPIFVNNEVFEFARVEADAIVNDGDTEEIDWPEDIGEIGDYKK